MFYDTFIIRVCDNAIRRKILEETFMATKQYSCVKRTKKAFEESLVQLSNELPLNKITVKMLCERAELSRNAFYFHYSDINALIDDIENSVVGEVEQLLRELEDIGFPKNVYASVSGIIDIFDARKETCVMLFDKTSNDITVRLSELFCNFYYKYFREFHSTDDRVNYDFFYMFLSNGFYGLLRYWFNNYDKMSRNEVTALAYVLVKRLMVPKNPEINFVAMKEDT